MVELLPSLEMGRPDRPMLAHKFQLVPDASNTASLDHLFLAGPSLPSRGRKEVASPATISRISKTESGGPELKSLCDTTLLILGPAGSSAPPYRLWAYDLGGLGLYMDGKAGLIDWLERNIFVKAVVMVDDDRLDKQDAANIAADVRQVRADIPVILAIGNDDDEIEPDTGRASFAVEHRPLALSSFVKAIEIARLMANFDREKQPRRILKLAVQIITYPKGAKRMVMGSY